MANPDRPDESQPILGKGAMWNQSISTDSKRIVQESKDKEWIYSFDPETGVLILVNQDSQTSSVVVIGIDDRLLPGSFRYLGSRNGPRDDDHLWKQQHRQVMNLT